MSSIAQYRLTQRYDIVAKAFPEGLSPQKQRQFRFGDPMTSDYFRVIGHRYPVGVSFTGNSRRFHRPIHLMNRSVKTP